MNAHHSRAPGAWVVGVALLAGLASAPADGQETAPPAGAEPTLSTRQELTGDWGGTRTDLFADGVTFAPGVNVPTKYFGKSGKHIADTAIVPGVRLKVVF